MVVCVRIHSQPRRRGTILVQDKFALQRVDMDYLQQALSTRLMHHARWLGVPPPFDGGVLVWDSQRYYHVSGRDRNGRRVLIEVFRIGSDESLEAVLAFQYPPPIRDLFPGEYGLLYKDDPWEGAFPPSRTSV
ncbi:conserved hypothetical protein [Cupriavidus taiwanensis]|nr:conserved hypothetical protein [Cupriavidus taiwanensis]